MRFLQADIGSVAVEFALVLPILSLLIAGLIDLGNAIDTQSKLDLAARAGAQVALTYAYDTDGITNAVQTATIDGANITLSSAPYLYCTCSDSKDTVNAWAASKPQCMGSATPAPCGGLPVRNYVSITVQETRASVPSFMGLGIATNPLTATSIVEVQSVQSP